ncbi:MAG: ethanolamine utilization cob(I)yrinic acid a,c-diamide adenosyltransferase EutT [Ignavibacterium sp.]|nr:ethanolamine utilization cob(I)yrinic acid a,c-diamide adenosyltransferase EutT [Ignavibacterium sp.]
MNEKFLTETELREKFSLTWGTEIHLPYNTRLTPSASQYLNDRKVSVKYIDEQGKVFVKNSFGDNDNKEKKVHPLTTSDQRPDALYCGLCNNKIETKSDVLTWLDSNHLVPKNHPQIAFRGKLDSMISYAVLVQNEFVNYDGPEIIKRFLADIRSNMGNVLKAEVKDENLDPIFMGDFSDDAIRKISHNPLKYLGHDHIVPELSHGKWVASLNYLRSMVREAELVAANLYIDSSLNVLRPDIMRALNRLSSALYIVMIMVLVSDKGKKIDVIIDEIK